MTERHVTVELLQRFEAGLDPRHPERSAVPARVLGYGEISTVFAIDVADAAGWAFKRMPMFRDEGEAQAYEALYREYVRVLGEQIGLHVAAGRRGARGRSGCRPGRAVHRPGATAG